MPTDRPTAGRLPPHRDLLALTAALVDIDSVSHQEGPIADVLEAELRSIEGLTVDRVGDNVVARTELGRAARLLLVGHTDTVPASGDPSARIEGDVLHGLGSTDMKAGLAVMVDLARHVQAPAVDLTWVFYAREEVAAVHSGLQEIIDRRPELLVGDAAILGEPTDGWVEAGCQGTMRLEVHVRGEPAHTARPWMGRNAIHRLGDLLVLVAAAEQRRPVLAGCEFRESLQAVAIDGGVAGNVVPDAATVTINHRFAPDRTAAEAEAYVRALLEPALEPDDEIVVVDRAAAAPPGIDHPLLRSLVDRSALEVRAKLGWTDVARLASIDVPAINLGPGDPTLAHAADELVRREPLERVAAALADLISAGASS